MTEIIIPIENCLNCPYFKKVLCRTEDSWEEAYDIYCTKTNKKIAGYVEWYDEMPDVPNWCPIKKDA